MPFIAYVLLAILAGVIGAGIALLQRRARKASLKPVKPLVTEKELEYKVSLSPAGKVVTTDVPDEVMNALMALDKRLRVLEVGTPPPSISDKVVELPLIPEATELIEEKEIMGVCGNVGGTIVTNPAKVTGKLMRPSLHCFRCKHNWKQLGENKPKHCPACHSTLWNKRVKKI
jgi:predicted Zn-ribbon and HTH transcriptional regulator